jgi:P pilus assembly protein, chaperone PapD
VMQAASPLATDRETLFWLNIKSIPASEASASDNTLQIAVNTRIKLIYRPAALKGVTPDDASKQLKWTRQEKNLTVNNPTPFYINFNAISVGGQKVENVTYVAPRSSATFTLPQIPGGNQVEWKVISDYGAIGPSHQGSL